MEGTGYVGNVSYIGTARMFKHFVAAATAMVSIWGAPVATAEDSSKADKSGTNPINFTNDLKNVDDFEGTFYGASANINLGTLGKVKARPTTPGASSSNPV